MNLDVHSQRDLERYYQLFDNSVLDTIFGVANGTGPFLQFCDQSSIAALNNTCFASLLAVRDCLADQEAADRPGRVPDPPLARFTPISAEAVGGVEFP